MTLVQITMFVFISILCYEAFKPVVSKLIDSFKKSQDVQSNDN